MESVRIHYDLIVKSEDENKIHSTYRGQKNNNQIKFKEGNIHVTLEIEEDSLTMKRSTEEYEIEMPFKKGEQKEGIYQVIGVPVKMHLLVETEEYKKNGTEIEVIYILYLNNENIGTFHFHLTYEVIE